jgi:UDP-N-acetylmuramyl tripeptide synthase
MSQLVQAAGDARRVVGIAIGKAAGSLSRRLRMGGGTTLPGKIARRVAPGVLGELSAALPHGALLITGTNGKTTTSRMLAEILRAGGERVLHNRAGANLIAGLTATAVDDADWRGRPRATIGLFETDEAALPQALAEIQPRLVLVHNLFRDQLDRYGEVDTVAGAWRAALAKLPPESRVVLNADDPAVADLGADLAAQVMYYGIDDARHAAGAAAHIADSQFCRRCGHRYEFTLAFYAHIGHYRCPRCGHGRPEPQVRLARLELQGTAGSRLYLLYPGGAMEVDLPLPGLYNAVNATAAVAAALALGVPAPAARNALERFSAAFGRIERISAGPGGPPMLLALIKNPVGATETVRMLVGATGADDGPMTNGHRHDTPTSTADELPSPLVSRPSSPDEPPSALVHRPSSPDELPSSLVSRPSSAGQIHLLIAINDRFADGTDVSWLWDAEFEPLAAHLAAAVVSGTRADDMAVRLKYAGVPESLLRVEPNLGQAIDLALADLPQGATLYVLPTYTAMLELRDALAQRGWVRQFWEE